MVEPQPSKLMMWVRFPSPALVLQVSCPRSSAVEHFLGKEEATGSSPVVGSNPTRVTIPARWAEGRGNGEGEV